MGFLKWITGGHAQRGHHGGGHGSGHGGGHGNGHHERGRDPHGWGWQAPAAGGAPLRRLACAGCGALNDTQARFCTQCGAAQQSAACSRCHAALAAGARFCPACGTQAA
ncbi:zinc ribbon domain-containing protein [Burkholderia ubonensis]|uniref:zinc ribbon domain-containing protein n=1 Tax=Burkholderia ubonensis TaxID=101571 RepID=UPI002AB31110|nr:zinc ribbon domain-containing protein [Burkholderia ubonensis]